MTTEQCKGCKWLDGKFCKRYNREAMKIPNCIVKEVR